jgi:hypothetical protein
MYPEQSAQEKGPEREPKQLMELQKTRDRENGEATKTEVRE